MSALDRAAPHLFEVESEHHHIGRGSLQTLRKHQLCGIGQVGSVALQRVVQPETELNFRNQLEERQIKVAAETHFREGLQWTRADITAFRRGEVIHHVKSAHHIGTKIIIARAGDFDEGRNGDIRRFHVLRELLFCRHVAKGQVLRAEMQRRGDAKCQIARESPFAQDTYRETEVLSVILAHPLCTVGLVDVAVVDEFQPLVMESDLKAVVPRAFVDERFVLHHTLLCSAAKCGEAKEENEEQPCGHRGKQSEEGEAKRRDCAGSAQPFIANGCPPTRCRGFRCAA